MLIQYFENSTFGVIISGSGQVRENGAVSLVACFVPDSTEALPLDPAGWPSPGPPLWPFTECLEMLEVRKEDEPAAVLTGEAGISRMPV